ncbi:phosphatase PAP2 family protein [Fructilactobacillus myrtifloralis]|uniref:Phosphatase PAP2 family protein n=1 Tax=Fructilactobacillus myrtifloralis TaxID=2940301 RepID=A0ABY5BQ37_9LACO|nr:phosphatase PAP2 family protein [Fructilactobacillus myrtifloralis]USS85670.1 phosphatase PAP2 family protein [Fructilactobacillus myrtifloralis]
MIIKKDPSRPYKLVIATLLTIIIAVAVKTNSGFVNFLDTLVIGGVQHWDSNFMTSLFTIVSFLASPKMDVIWMILLAFILWGGRDKIPAVFAICLLVGGDALGFVVKHLVARDRPPMHLMKDTGYSFPSGHVLGTVLVLSIIWIVLVPMLNDRTSMWIVRMMLIIWLILVMLSRIYLNAHFPSDVVGAVTLAYAWLQVAEYLYVRYAPRLATIKGFQNSNY